MSTHMTKTWFVGGEFIKQLIPESEMYKQEPIKWEPSEEWLDIAVDAAMAQQEREWVGLTDEEISEVLGADIHAEQSGELRFIRAIEAKLKEKNT